MLAGNPMAYNILLADDNKDFRKEIKYILNDFNIIEASNGNEAIKLLKKNKNIDLAILDEKMPGMNGTKVLKSFKSLNPKIIVIILTAFSSERTVIDAIKGHADDYLKKTRDINNLEESVKKLLKMKEIKEIQKSSNPDINAMNKKNKVDYVKKLIEKNFDKILSLEFLAKEVFLSPKYLSRIFKELTGESILNFRIYIKVEKAKKLLTDPNKKIEDIAYELGYKKYDSFNKVFKGKTGYTLSEFKKLLDKTK